MERGQNCKYLIYQSEIQGVNFRYLDILPESWILPDHAPEGAAEDDRLQVAVVEIEEYFVDNFRWKLLDIYHSEITPVIYKQFHATHTILEIRSILAKENFNNRNNRRFRIIDN